jgi:hypothetical protein
VVPHNLNTQKYSSHYTTFRQVRRHHNVCHQFLPVAQLLAVSDEGPDDKLVTETWLECDLDNTDSSLMEAFSDDVTYSCDDSFSNSPDNEGIDNIFHDIPPILDGNEVVESEELDLHYAVASINQFTDYELPSFKQNLVSGNAMMGVSMLVAQACYQAVKPPKTNLPLRNITLVLYLSKLVISTGRLRLGGLSQVISILYPYADHLEKQWAPLPCTVSGFRSCILNVSNSNSLVSILPIPHPEALPDGHGYTLLRNIMEHALMLKKFKPQETKDPKWQSIASCQKFKAFMSRVSNHHRVSSIRKLAMGLLVWTDGWDKSTGCKSNCSPMHTGTVTLRFVNIQSKSVVGIATYPNMGGPDKIDHGPVFQQFKEVIFEFEADDDNRVFACRHFSSDVEIHTKVIFIIQDQPERRQASCLLGGNSILHPLFGVSCDNSELAVPFSTCQKCIDDLEQYVSAKDWSRPPMSKHCSRCIGWSLRKFMKVKYETSYPAPSDFKEATPGASLFIGPGRLTSEMLIDSWNHCIDMFAVKYKWLECDVKKYLHQLCINNASIALFLNTCRCHVYMNNICDNAEDYSDDEVASSIQGALENPDDYSLPKPPAMWKIREVEDKTEGIMHLSMGVQKAIFKFIIKWASQHKKGSTLQRRLAKNLRAVQDLKLSYCPCRPYKDDKFGGSTAETYRSMTMLSCLLSFRGRPGATQAKRF